MRFTLDFGEATDTMLPCVEELAEVIGGEPHGSLPAGAPAGVSTDSRSVRPGEIFFALRGERFDGHDYVAAALQAGAAPAVVSRVAPDLPADAPLVVVPDTLAAYGRLGQWVRRRSSASVLAVTGSTGKTSTKNLLADLLRRQGPTHVAEGTENNEIGVPRTLLGLRPEHRFCVLELGMRARGEIAHLARLGEPQIGVITNIGLSHLGLLGSREAIAQAKAELLAALPAGGRAVLNADDFFYPLLQEMSPCPVISFGLDPEAEVGAEGLELCGLQGSRFTLRVGGERLPVSLPLPGQHNVLNALAAVAAAWAATGSREGLAEGLAAAQGEPMRGQVLALPGNLTVINDAYNASPTSVAAALKLLATVPGRKVFVFGDMLELGERAQSEHRRVGERAAQAGVDWVLAVGALAAVAAEAAGAAGREADAVEEIGAALDLLRERLRPGDTVLVKASRRMALERIVEGLRHAD